MVRNEMPFYGGELLASRPTPKLEDHPLSATRGGLFKYILNYPPYLEVVSSVRNQGTHHTVVDRGLA
jgi:hypothetical protein